MEEAILDQLELGTLSPDVREQLLDQIAEIIADKLVMACAGDISDLEAGRIEYLAAQGDSAALESELRRHVPDSAALLRQIGDETLAELRQNIAELQQP